MRVGCAMKGDARRRQRDKRQCKNQPANKGKWEERRHGTRGGGVLMGRAEAAAEAELNRQEAEA